MKKVLIIFGTRPEAIKLAPVIQELRSRPGEFNCLVCSSGQHREMVAQALAAFGLKADIDLAAMTEGQTLGGLTARLFAAYDTLLQAEKPDWVIVQGDTTTAMVGAVSAFYGHIKVAHVEAGLRTGNRLSPFPEEINRTFIGHVSDLHFAPTARAVEQLRQSGVPPQSIHLTGNTVVDALLWMTERSNGEPPASLDSLLPSLDGRRLVLVTSHRRESFGGGLKNICFALREIVQRHTDVVVVYPVHPNPNVREAANRWLASEERIRLVEPLSYQSVVYLLRRCYCVLTDSGGLQEEAPTFGKPLLILRDTTERPEVIEAGCARLVGTSVERLVNATNQLLEDPVTYQQMARVENPFGDGKAAQRIAQILANS